MFSRLPHDRQSDIGSNDFRADVSHSDNDAGNLSVGGSVTISALGLLHVVIARSDSDPRAKHEAGAAIRFSPRLAIASSLALLAMTTGNDNSQ
jgi:hypothetical protein